MRCLVICIVLIPSISFAQHRCIGEFAGHFGLDRWELAFFQEGSYTSHTKSCMYDYYVYGTWEAEGDSIRMQPVDYRDNGSRDRQPYSPDKVMGLEQRIAILRNDTLFVGREGRPLAHPALLRVPPKQ